MNSRSSAFHDRSEHDVEGTKIIGIARVQGDQVICSLAGYSHFS